MTAVEDWLKKNQAAMIKCPAGAGAFISLAACRANRARREYAHCEYGYPEPIPACVGCTAYLDAEPARAEATTDVIGPKPLQDMGIRAARKPKAAKKKRPYSGERRGRAMGAPTLHIRPDGKTALNASVFSAFPDLDSEFYALSWDMANNRVCFTPSAAVAPGAAGFTKRGIPGGNYFRVSRLANRMRALGIANWADAFRGTHEVFRDGDSLFIVIPASETSPGYYASVNERCEVSLPVFVFEALPPKIQNAEYVAAELIAGDATVTLWESKRGNKNVSKFYWKKEGRIKAVLLKKFLNRHGLKVRPGRYPVAISEVAFSVDFSTNL